MVAAALPVLAGATTLVCRQALDDAVAGQHAPIDGEVPADHKGTHGGILLGQAIRFVCQICLVLAAVDQDQARIPTSVPVALVHGILPPTTPAETYSEAFALAMCSLSSSSSSKCPIPRASWASLPSLSHSSHRRGAGGSRMVPRECACQPNLEPAFSPTIRDGRAVTRIPGSTRARKLR